MAPAGLPLLQQPGLWAALRPLRGQELFKLFPKRPRKPTSKAEHSFSLKLIMTQLSPLRDFYSNRLYPYPGRMQCALSHTYTQLHPYTHLPHECTHSNIPHTDAYTHCIHTMHTLYTQATQHEVHLPTVTLHTAALCLTEHTRTHTCKSPNIHTCNTQLSFHLFGHLWTHSHVRHGPATRANLDCCRQGLLPVLPLLLPVTRHHRGLHREAGRPGTQNKKPNPHSAVGLTSERTAGALELLSKHEVSRSRGSEFIIMLPPLLRTGLS